MAQKLDTFNFTARGSRYSWDEWLDGTIWRLSQDTDFAAKPTSFLATVRKQADKRNKQVNTQIEGTDVIIQAY